MSDKRIIFYGVDNGQSVRTALNKEINLLFDIKQKPEDADDSDKTWDIHESLLRDLPENKEGRHHLSVFCLSHPDLDHCQGFGRVFYLPNQNDEEDEDLIQIDELWVTAQIFNEKLENQAKKVQKEARRRLKLWANNSTKTKATKPGNMLVVFGRFEDEQGLENLPEERHIGAGESFDRICGKSMSEFELFVHWPFKKAIDDDETPRNETSLVVQMSIKEGNNVSQLLIGGDAGCEVWEEILNVSKEKKRIDRLNWDIFFCPHHGTYKFFTKKEHEEGRKEAEDDPESSSMEILSRGRKNGLLVCSSRPVREDNYDDKNPPHIEGIKHYRNTAVELGDEENFICLMEHPDQDCPKPLVVKITPNGHVRDIEKQAIIGSSAVNTTRRWG